MGIQWFDADNVFVRLFLRLVSVTTCKVIPVTAHCHFSSGYFGECSVVLLALASKASSP